MYRCVLTKKNNMERRIITSIVSIHACQIPFIVSSLSHNFSLSLTYPFIRLYSHTHTQLSLSLSLLHARVKFMYKFKCILKYYNLIETQFYICERHCFVTQKQKPPNINYFLLFLILITSIKYCNNRCIIKYRNR